MSTNTIEELNFEEAKQYIGGVVFVTILMVVGIIGNVHVIFVYAFKMKPSNHRIFILVLAVIDLITCSIGMPFIIFHLRNPLTFTMVSACKVLRFINYFICESSAMVLLVIAVERYRKICVPLGRQISQKTAKLSCLGVLGIALLLSWPAPVLYGGSTVQIDNHNVTGTRCYTEDKFKDTNLQSFFNAVLFFVIFSGFTSFVVVYCLIGRVIARHSTFNVTNKLAARCKSNTLGTAFDTREIHVPPNSPIEHSTISTGSISTFSSKNFAPLSEITRSSIYADTYYKQSKEEREFGKMRKTTYMLCVITVVFFLSYFPHLILQIITVSNANFVPNMSFTGKVFYNTFNWCFFINNMTNPIIYGFCDVRFKREVFSVYTNLYKRR